MAKICFVRPYYDRVTSILHGFGDYIVDYARQAGVHACNNLSGASATRERTEAALRDGCDIFVFYGHGDPIDGSFVGNPVTMGRQEVIDSDNAYFLSGKIIYAASCVSAKGLGIQCIHRGARCFIGYKDMLRVNPKYESIMRQVVNAPLDRILKKENPTPIDCVVAVSVTKELFKQLADYYFRGEGSNNPDSLQIAVDTLWNVDNLACLVVVPDGLPPFGLLNRVGNGDNTAWYIET